MPIYRITDSTVTRQMTGDRIFVATNIVIYSLGNDLEKKAISATILSCNPVLSTQVLLETAHVARRKLGFSVAQVREVLSRLRTDTQLCVINERTIDRSLLIAERNGLSTYDSLIVASALESGCRILFSEDMHAGQLINGQLTVVNPFLDK